MQLVRGRKVNFFHGVGTFFPLDTAPPAGRPVGVGPLQALHDGLLEKAGLKQTSLWLFSYANQKILTLKNLRESAIQTLKQNRIT
ncbi:MAG TPA: hypothetical protein VFU82_05165 [Gammaproteobacteria bacterium]|nr:hypothetical protein [Gammaproteobacteria bacterium]